MPETAAILLAAGRSSRSGAGHKLLATRGGKTLLETTLVTLRSVFTADRIYVVTGHRQEDFSLLLGPDIRTVHNPDYTDGMGTSIAAGIKGLPAVINRAFICLADMPFVSTETFRALAQAATACPDAGICLPVYNNRRGHPVLWHRKLFPFLQSLQGDTGGRSVIQNHETEVHEVFVDDPGIHTDLDTPDMLAQHGFRA